MPERYSADYYNSVNYVDYAERSERYIRLAHELSNLLHSLGIDRKSSILDYGCGFGFLIEGLVLQGYRNVTGYDISTYAKEICEKKDIIFPERCDNYYDIKICLDVFEHMTDEEVYQNFINIKSDIIIGRIPIKRSSGDDSFFLECSRKDPTHINCKTKEEWVKLLQFFDYRVIFHLNLFSIYDSEGVFSFLAVNRR